jgi:hypothetical protein
MRSVSGSILRFAAGAAVVVTLLAAAAPALAADESKPRNPLLQRIVVWIQSRMSVPGG